MIDLTRRHVFGATAAGLVGLRAATGATAAIAAAAQQPAALLGSVQDQQVSLPPLMAATEAEGSTPNVDPPARRLGVAVVGLGHLALNQILPGFGQARHVRLAALVSGERDKARAVADQHGVAERHLYDYASFDRLRDDADVDIVYIVLPNALHAEFTARAAAAGKHVLCEKPMATSEADAQRMVDACRDAQRKLMIAYRCQYVPAHRAAMAMARQRELGPVRLIEAVNGQNNADNGQWRHIKALAGGGSLPDVGLYCLNAARYLTGEEPVEVTGRITQPTDDPRFREVEDLCSFTLRFPSGVLASCSSGYSFHESRQLRVMAEGGWFGLDPAFGYDNIRLQLGRRAGPANAIETRDFTPHNQFAQEMDHFALCIRHDLVPRTPGEEGLQDQRLIAAIYAAAAGGGVVKLPAVDRLDSTRGPPPTEG